MSEYPIRPGSSVDLALNAMLRTTFDLEPNWELHGMQAIDTDNDTHMLALGVRFWYRKHGVTDPFQLVAPEYARWYGQLSS